MRMLDGLSSRLIENLQLYLSADEAKQLRDALARLLADPEATEHVHVFSRDMRVELSASIVTEAKVAAGGYTAAEQALLRDHP